MRDHKRTRKVIDLRFQSFIAMEIIVYSLFLPVLLIIFLAIEPFSTMFSSRDASTHFNTVMDLLRLNASKWPLLILILLFVGVLSVVFSHHIAGPVFRFRRTIMSLLDGDLSHRVKLRRFDYLKDLSHDLNRFMGDFSTELKELKSASENITGLADKLASSKHEIKAEIEKIRENSSRIEKLLSKYRFE